MATGLSTISLGLLKCHVPHPLFKRTLSLVGKTVVKLHFSLQVHASMRRRYSRGRIP